MAENRGSSRQDLNTGRLRQLINSIPLAWRLFLDDRVSPAVKTIPIMGFLYLLWPIDLLPDLFPALGQLDDIAVILLALNWFIQVCPSDIVEEIRQGGRTGRSNADDDAISARYTVIEGKKRDEA